jgi:hypothetical protein
LFVEVYIMDLPGERILLSSIQPIDYEHMGSENPKVPQATKSPWLMASSFAHKPASENQLILSSAPAGPKRTPLSPVVANSNVDQPKDAPAASTTKPLVTTGSTSQSNPFARSSFRSTLLGFKVRS